MISDTEGLILMTLYNLENGIQSSEMKKTIVAMKSDIDELEEGLESLREEAYIRYENRRWYITKDGKSFLEEIATFEPSIGHCNDCYAHGCDCEVCPDFGICDRCDHIHYTSKVRNGD